MVDIIKENFLDKYKMKLSSAHAIENMYLENGVWEKHLLLYFNLFLKPGDVCVDVGANCGFHTIALADRVLPGGKVIAFEPNSVTFPRLVDNINLNPQLAPIVTCNKIGLGKENEILKVFQSGELLGNAYVAESINEAFWNSGGKDDFELCIVKPLDSYQLDSLQFMKIDVEGMEIDVLRGSVETLKRFKPIIVFETLIECFDNEKIKECEMLLRSLGYYLFGLDQEKHKLSVSSYPNLQEDTIAIHRDKLIDYAEVLANAALYRVHAVSAPSFGEASFIFCAAEDAVPHLRIVREGAVITTRGLKGSDNLRFEFDWKGKATELEIQFTSQFKSFRGNWKSNLDTATLSGEIQGGTFKL